MTTPAAPAGPPRPPRRRATLAETALLTPAVRLLRLRLPEADAGEAPFRFAPGQWVALELPLPEQRLPRAYSLASRPTELPCFDIIVTQVPDSAAANYLWSLEPGATLEFTGPFGTFVLPETLTAPVILMATGTGVAPLRPMIHTLLGRREAPPSITLLFGGRTEADLLYREEFEALAEEDPRFVYGPVLSRAPDTWQGARGYVQAALVTLIADQPKSHVFACGLRRMVDDVRQFLGARGVPRGQIHFERYD